MLSKLLNTSSFLYRTFALHCRTFSLYYQTLNQVRQQRAKVWSQRQTVWNRRKERFSDVESKSLAEICCSPKQNTKLLKNIFRPLYKASRTSSDFKIFVPCAPFSNRPVLLFKKQHFNLHFGFCLNWRLCLTVQHTNLGFFFQTQQLRFKKIYYNSISYIPLQVFNFNKISFKLNLSKLIGNIHVAN